MTTDPDPEERDRRDPARRDSADATDAEFAAIIAGWRTEPDAPRWPTEQDRIDQRRPEEDQPRTTDSRIDEGAEDHFEPPEPPPLPVPRPRTLGGILLLVLGVLLLVRPDLLSVGESMGTPLGLLTVTAGIGWLVLGLRGGPPREGWDDGAQL